MTEPDFVNPTDGYEMALIPAGKAIFGSREDDPDAYGHPKPPFELELPAYYLGLYPVTNAQYAAFLTAAQPEIGDLRRWVSLGGGHAVVARGSEYVVEDEERHGDRPVISVQWYGAEAYCQWAGLRLPTELEWEKGARGTDGRAYPWGDDWDASKCRHKDNRGAVGTCRVWEYPEGVSPYGLYNMSGNAWEWTADLYDERAYERYSAGDPTPPAKGSRRALRGGSYEYDMISYLRATSRLPYEPWDKVCRIFAFRCARDESPPQPTPQRPESVSVTSQPQAPAREARPTAEPAYRNLVDGYEMGLVPAGKALFGSREDDARASRDERPQIELSLPAYYLGTYCVTNAQYAEFLNAVRPEPSDLDTWIDVYSGGHVVARGAGYGVDGEERYGDHPVVEVSWFGAKAYCDWAGLRLPSEREWEKAARGPKGLVYPWGNEWDPSKCRWDGNREDETTCRVWDYPDGRSPYGMYNMSGNVWEWTTDWYKVYSVLDLTPPTKGSAKTCRGGSYGLDDPRALRAAYRSDFTGPLPKYDFLGFRCAKYAPPQDRSPSALSRFVTRLRRK